MSRKYFYLKPNVIIEPLIDRWYAWSYLVPPFNYALYLHNKHIKVMESYVKNSKIHALALKNANMRGGPFIDYDGNYVAEIKFLLENIYRTKKDFAQLVEAINQLEILISLHSSNASLSGIYESLPECLRGFVELVYNHHNNLSYRIIEPLVYHSKYYQIDNQEICLSIIDSDSRLSVVNTPRVIKGNNLFLNIPFSDHKLDQLVSLRTVPEQFSFIEELFDTSTTIKTKLQDFFTTTPPFEQEILKHETSNDSISWHYFGHACVLLKLHNINILIDPMISYSYATSIARYTYCDLPKKIDYILITHNHQDHFSLETLLQLRSIAGAIIVPKNNTGCLVDPSLKLILKQLGFKNVIEFDEMQTIHDRDVVITGLPFFGEHGDLNIYSKLAYHVKFKKYSVCFAADSCNIEPYLYKRINMIIGDIDTLFIGMECEGAPMSWIYGPFLPPSSGYAMDQSRRLNGSNCQQAVAIINQLRPKNVYIYALGLEPWLTYISSSDFSDTSSPIINSRNLMQECLKQGIQAEMLYCKKSFIYEES